MKVLRSLLNIQMMMLSRQLVDECAAQVEAWPADINLGIVSIHGWLPGMECK